jgi:hypothetical protein
MRLIGAVTGIFGDKMNEKRVKKNEFNREVRNE